MSQLPSNTHTNAVVINPSPFQAPPTLQAQLHAGMIASSHSSPSQSAPVSVPMEEEGTERSLDSYFTSASAHAAPFRYPTAQVTTRDLLSFLLSQDYACHGPLISTAASSAPAAAPHVPAAIASVHFQALRSAEVARRKALPQSSHSLPELPIVPFPFTLPSTFFTARSQQEVEYFFTPEHAYRFSNCQILNLADLLEYYSSVWPDIIASYATLVLRQPPPADISNTLPEHYRLPRPRMEDLLAALHQLFGSHQHVLTTEAMCRTISAVAKRFAANPAGVWNNGGEIGEAETFQLQHKFAFLYSTYEQDDPLLRREWRTQFEKWCAQQGVAADGSKLADRGKAVTATPTKSPAMKAVTTPAKTQQSNSAASPFLAPTSAAIVASLNSMPASAHTPSQPAARPPPSAPAPSKHAKPENWRDLFREWLAVHYEPIAPTTVAAAPAAATPPQPAADNLFFIDKQGDQPAPPTPAASSPANVKPASSLVFTRTSGPVHVRKLWLRFKNSTPSMVHAKHEKYNKFAVFVNDTCIQLYGRLPYLNNTFLHGDSDMMAAIQPKNKAAKDVGATATTTTATNKTETTSNPVSTPPQPSAPPPPPDAAIYEDLPPLEDASGNSANAAARFSLSLKIGDECDCMDVVQKWCAARVVGENNRHQWHIHYIGWEDTWNEYVDKLSDRIAPKGSHVIWPTEVSEDVAAAGTASTATTAGEAGGVTAASTSAPTVPAPTPTRAFTFNNREILWHEAEGLVTPDEHNPFGLPEWNWNNSPQLKLSQASLFELMRRFCQIVYLRTPTAAPNQVTKFSTIITHFHNDTLTRLSRMNEKQIRNTLEGALRSTFNLPPAPLKSTTDVPCFRRPTVSYMLQQTRGVQLKKKTAKEKAKEKEAAKEAAAASAAPTADTSTPAAAKEAATVAPPTVFRAVYPLATPTVDNPLGLCQTTGRNDTKFSDECGIELVSRWLRVAYKPRADTWISLDRLYVAFTNDTQGWKQIKQERLAGLLPFALAACFPSETCPLNKGRKYHITRVAPPNISANIINLPPPGRQWDALLKHAATAPSTASPTAVPPSSTAAPAVVPSSTTTAAPSADETMRDASPSPTTPNTRKRKRIDDTDDGSAFGDSETLMTDTVSASADSTKHKSKQARTSVGAAVAAKDSDDDSDAETPVQPSPSPVSESSASAADAKQRQQEYKRNKADLERLRKRMVNKERSTLKLKAELLLLQERVLKKEQKQQELIGRVKGLEQWLKEYEQTAAAATSTATTLSAANATAAPTTTTPSWLITKANNASSATSAAPAPTATHAPPAITLAESVTVQPVAAAPQHSASSSVETAPAAASVAPSVPAAASVSAMDAQSAGGAATAAPVAAAEGEVTGAANAVPALAPAAASNDAATAAPPHTATSTSSAAEDVTMSDAAVAPAPTASSDAAATAATAAVGVTDAAAATPAAAPAASATSSSAASTDVVAMTDGTAATAASAAAAADNAVPVASTPTVAAPATSNTAASALAPLVIRRATVDDAAAYSDFLKTQFNLTFAADNDPVYMAEYNRTAFSADTQRAEIADPKVTAFIAERDNAIVGVAMMRAIEPEPCVKHRDAIEIQRLYVQAERIKTGVGAALMTRCLEYANSLGKATWLGVWERNYRAVNFYCRFGFEDVGEHVFQLGSDAQTDRVMERAAMPIAPLTNGPQLSPSPPVSGANASSSLSPAASTATDKPSTLADQANGAVAMETSEHA